MNNVEKDNFQFIYNGNFYYIFYKGQDVTENQLMANLLDINVSLLRIFLSKANTIMIDDNYYLRDIDSNDGLINSMIEYIKEKEKQEEEERELELNKKVIESEPDEKLEEYELIAKRLILNKVKSDLNIDINDEPYPADISKEKIKNCLDKLRDNKPYIDSIINEVLESL